MNRAQDPEVSTTPPRPRETSKPANDDYPNQRRGLHRPLREDRPAAPHLPSSLRRHFGFHDEPESTGHHLSVSSNQDTRLTTTQEQSSPVDNRVRRLLVLVSYAILNLNLGSSTDSAGYGTIHQSDTRYHARDEYTTHSVIEGNASVRVWIRRLRGRVDCREDSC